MDEIKIDWSKYVLSENQHQIKHLFAIPIEVSKSETHLLLLKIGWLYNFNNDGCSSDCKVEFNSYVITLLVLIFERLYVEFEFTKDLMKLTFILSIEFINFAWIFDLSNICVDTLLFMNED